MDAEVQHILYRGAQKPRRGDTRTIAGTIAEVSEDRQYVKLRISEDVDPVWVRADGVTAIGAPAEITVGTTGRPIATATTLAIPQDAEPIPVGPTGVIVLGQQVRLDGVEERLAGARESLTAAREEIAAARADLADAEQRLGGLTAEGVEALPGEVAEALYAKLGVVGRLQALQGIVTRDMIATGAVTAEQMTVTGELAAELAQILTLAVERLNVGENARFTSEGLVFYAPPAEGQAWDDWEQRTPLVALTPGGDVSVAVATAGEVTAGLTQAGEVWGRAGRFETLEVAGRSLETIAQDAPRGVVGITRLGSHIYLSNSGRLMFGVRAPLHKGRVYEYRYNLGISRDRGEVVVDTYLEHGGRHYKVGSCAIGHNGDLTSACVIDADEYDFADGEAVGVLSSVYTKTQGARGQIWAAPQLKAQGSWVALHDVGASVPIYTQTEQQAPPAQPVTQTRQVTSAYGRGMRPDGSRAVDGRLTIGGYSLYGSDMAEYVYYPCDLGFLDGATVTAATVTITIAQSAYSAQGTRLYLAAARQDGVHGRVNLQEVVGYPRGPMQVTIPGAHLRHLVGARGLILVPYAPGSSASYGYAGASVTVRATYRK